MRTFRVESWIWLFCCWLWVACWIVICWVCWPCWTSWSPFCTWLSIWRVEKVLIWLKLRFFTFRLPVVVAVVVAAAAVVDFYFLDSAPSADVDGEWGDSFAGTLCHIRDTRAIAGCNYLRDDACYGARVRVSPRNFCRKTDRSEFSLSVEVVTLFVRLSVAAAVEPVAGVLFALLAAAPLAAWFVNFPDDFVVAVGCESVGVVHHATVTEESDSRLHHSMWWFALARATTMILALSWRLCLSANWFDWHLGTDGREWKRLEHRDRWWGSCPPNANANAVQDLHGYWKRFHTPDRRIEDAVVSPRWS